MSDPITKISYTSDGTTTEYDVPFVYLSRGFVKVYINGFATTLFTWLTPTRIKLKRSPDAKSTILIQRETQLEPMVVFKDATNLTATDLNMLTNQALHLIQEGHNHITTLEMTGLANNEEFVLPPLDALSVLGILQGRISALELESGLNDRIDLIDASDNNLIDRMSIAEDSIDSLVTQIGSLAYSPYDAETTYALNDVISFEGKLYKSLQADNLGNAPDELESTYWLKISDAADLGAAINYEAATRLSDVGALAYQDAQLQATFDKLSEAALNNLDSLNKIDAKSSARYASTVDAIATETNARVTAVETLSTSLNDATTSIQTIAETTDGINAKYTVKIDANGYVVGYGLIANAAKDNNPPDSSFIIKADKFAFGYPGYQGAYPFQIGVVDGVSRVGVNGELLVDGTIGANKIKTEELEVGTNILLKPGAWIGYNQLTDTPNTTYIDANGIYTGTLTANQVNVWNSIQSAYPSYIAGIQGWKIDKYGQSEFQNIKARGDIEATSLKADTAMVGSANIQDLAVDTLKIADNAVSIPTSYVGGNNMSTSVIDSSIKKALVIVSCYSYCNSYNGSYSINIYRSGTLILTQTIQGFGQYPLYTGHCVVDNISGSNTYYTVSFSGGSVYGNITVTVMGLKK